MNLYKIRHYPTVLQAIHLVILYIFIQTVVDFPLAVIDYFRDTDYLYHPLKKIILGVGSVIFILWYGFRKTGNPLREVFPLKKFNLFLIFLFFLFFLGIQQWLNVVNKWVDTALPPPAWFWEMFDKIFENDFGFWGAFMKVVVIAPVVEELIFRGVIMHGLMRNYSKGAAVFFSGFLFALFHLNPWQFPATFVLGMILGWVMIRTRNIGLCITGHAINNLLVLSSITWIQQIKESPLASLSVMHVLMISAFMIILSLALMVVVTRGKNQDSSTVVQNGSK
jgi:membrane protease YdiL (CAAX protease family)